MNKLKIDFYDSFECIADKCPFTCCGGWEIKIDADTCLKWKNDTHQILKLSSKAETISNNQSEAFIRLTSDNYCPFLEERGLCSVVLNYTEDYLPKACRIFPRLENCFEEHNEYSLSLSCPAVVDLIYKKEDTIKICTEDENAIECFETAGSKIRDILIAIMQRKGFSRMDKILLAFHMLLLLHKEPVKTDELMKYYQDDNYLQETTRLWKNIKMVCEDTLLETGELFFDICLNYKKEKGYQKYLNPLSELAHKQESDLNMNKWKDFLAYFDQYEQLLEKCITMKIFSNCNRENSVERIMSLQLIITEYVMIKYSMYLIYLSQEERNPSDRLNYQDIRDYIVIYSRMIENNPKGMEEFWEECFDEPIWDFGYLLLLIYEEGQAND